MRYLEGCTLTAFTRGSRALVLRIKSTGYKPTWSHAGGLAVGTWLFWPTIGPLVPAGLTTMATLWLLIAVILGNTGTAATAPTTAGAAAESTSSDPPQELQAPPSDDVLTALIRHTAALSDQGTAAHLPDLLAEGQKRGEFDGWKQADLKAHLTALGAPLVEKKKLTFGGAQRTRQAVLLDGLPEADPAPVPAIVQSAA